MSIKRAHLDELQRIRQRVNALFEEALFGSGLPAREEREPGTWTPAVDVVETDDAFVLVAELPGVRREDIDVEVDDRRLEISGRRLPVEEGQSFVRMERSYGPFRRSFELDPSIDAGKISAKIEQGVVTLTLPKAEQVKPRRITVS